MEIIFTYLVTSDVFIAWYVCYLLRDTDLWCSYTILGCHLLDIAAQCCVLCELINVVQCANVVPNFILFNYFIYMIVCIDYAAMIGDGVRRIVMHVSVCIWVIISQKPYIRASQNYLHVVRCRGSFLLCRNMLCNCSFVDDVMFWIFQ